LHISFAYNVSVWTCYQGNTYLIERGGENLHINFLGEFVLN
jgi:hypothetical protein